MLSLPTLVVLLGAVREGLASGEHRRLAAIPV